MAAVKPVGSEVSYAIRDIAALVAEVVGFRGAVRWDRSRPDGVALKLLDSSEIRRLGWSPRTDLAAGLAVTYRLFLEHEAVTTTVEAP